ncbi:uncharacterized protein LOC125278075 isoform X2 [Megalobrama amblycephala]|uniref:uncharacterized protein LOC125278075 isoform X2 n=1 Tax=Megalobrama amblycephala TaxID=75352 RepID=UPI002013F783|nr:uncharacterized protein LOC125278075 isoform X2 [Megalobrama amblycephala]
MVFIVFKSVVWSLLIILCKCLISTTAAESRAAVSPVLDCELYHDTYICIGAQYRMYCNTRMHRFYYQRYQDQNQYQCLSNDCLCVGNNDTCACYYNTSSCFCEIFSNNNTIPTAVRPVLDCELNNNTYICTGARYHMYCNTTVHYFSYSKYLYQNQNQYQCWNNNCDCRFNKDSCTCYSSVSSSCFCTNYGYSIALSSTRSPVTDPDCRLYNDTYICAGTQYSMYCNTRMHNFYYWRYQNQNQHEYQCWNNNCDCRGNKDTCTCYSSTLSSCFCENYNNNITIPTAVSPVTDPDCVLYNDTYICTGAQYRMYCNTRMHYFSSQRYQYQNQYQCVNNNCNCYGNKDTCTCYSHTLSSCFCETYGNIIALTTAVTPVYDCVLYNDTYICTGAQYRMYCNTGMHYFSYRRYQNQNQYEYQCWNNNCDCRGNKDTCTCYSRTLSSCFCENYNNNITIPTAVTPVYDCVLYNDTYICTGAQYRMYCNTGMHHFSYWRYQNQNQYENRCWNNNCDCRGNKDTCTCYSRTLSSCFCETYGYSIALITAVPPAYGCVLYNDTYICAGAQYRMYCNTTMHYFSYRRYQNQNQHEYQCWNNNCDCRGNKDTCTCYSRTLSSCFCENYNNNNTIPTAVSPVYDCVLYNDTYICTGAQYRMYCNTGMHHFSYWRYQNQNQYEYRCWNNCDCRGNKDTCTCYSRTLSSCFCETYGYSIALITAVPPAYGCVLYNDTYICAGAQYRMYCNTRMHYFSYRRYQNQNQHEYQCWNNYCDCRGNKDTCTCSSSTFSSCFCENYNNNITIPTAVSPVTDPDCVLYNDTYICTGAQYRMYCNTRMHYFYYQRYQYQNQYQCVNNNCNCYGNKDTCTCYSHTLSSCFCETYGNIIALTTAVSPVYDCVLYNDTYICTGAQYRMYCNTGMHYFSYWRYQNQNQYEYQCWNNNCNCIGNKDTCTCYSRTLSSCFCENYNNNITIPTAVSPIYDCGLYNDTYICTGAQYRMYCNTGMHYFSYWRYQNQNQYEYQCWNNNCNCIGNKDTCTCYSRTLSSCFCENYNNNITIPTAVSPIYDCGLYNDTYICTGAQYRMYCNTRMHHFSYWRYQNQNQYENRCWNNNCDCRGNKDTCTCYSRTLSSCFCENYNNNITIPTAVSPIYDCGLYNDTYICTGAQYRMYCNTRMHHFSYWRYQNQNQYENRCWNNNCDCRGNKDTCTCYSRTLSSCFCETYGNIIALITAVPPAYDCVLYNDTYICAGAQYRMYCNTTMHYFSYRRYQNQNQHEYRCWNYNCNCVGNNDTCTCYSSTFSSCFCENYNNNITIPTAVSPVTDPDCVLYNDTYICTGAQYRMYCNTRMHDFYYQRYQNQNQYEYRCWNNCDCRGNKDTCTCYSRTLSSCFCETYGYSIALITAVPPAYGCVLYNDTYICAGAQYRMYCNTRMHYFSYRRYQNQNQHEYRCWNNNCDCRGNKDTCTCSSNTFSSCFCENYNNNITIPTAVSPVTDPDCVLYNDTYICTGAQYRMYCNTRMHYFYYQRYQYQNQYQCVNNNCNCYGNKDTCTCYSHTLSSCFCETYGNIIALTTAVTPVYDCVPYNDTYICTGAQYRMYCNTGMHYFSYWRYQNQNQYEYQCWNNNCNCIGNKDTCTCYSRTLSSCFCENYNNNITIPTAVSPIYDCGLYNDTYICTGAQYRMYCNTRMHHFSYWRYQNQNQHEYRCWNNNCDCRGNKDTCTCYSRTLSSCFCETYGYSIALITAVPPAYGCVLYNDTYICAGAQYRMYCNTRMHYFSYRRYQNQNQHEYRCWNYNCNCVGNNDTCTCSSSTFSSCFCENYNNNITIPTAVTPVYDCVLYNDTYICTGAQYRMYCNTRMHDFYYQRYQYQNQYQCVNNNCNCYGNKDTCTCYSHTLSSCFCETYGYSIALITAVPPAYECGLNNDTYICTGAQYRMYCNTTMHYFSYRRYQNQNQHEYQCWNNNCDCRGNKDTCTCYSRTLSSCFCENYNNNITIPTAVSPIYDCGLYNDTYICTGAQYRMYCNTGMHHFSYWRYQNQNQYENRCWNNNCDCRGNKDTCTCYSRTLSSCFCETYGYSIALITAVPPAYECGLNNDTYICTGAQYRMYCNTRMHYFFYRRYQNQNQHEYRCWNNCDCRGNKDTCTCYSRTLSSCFCENYSNNITIPTAVTPAYGCVLYNDTYICTGAQYRMYCNTRMHDFSYWRYQNQNLHQYQCSNNNCNCIGNEDTCTCYTSTLSSCFCETYGNIIALITAVTPAYDCVLYNKTYICTGAQYRMYCNTTMHDFNYWRYQNQNQYEYQCWNNNCNCVGNKDTCTCSSMTLSSCFCEYNISTPTTISPTTTGLDNILPDQCRSQISGGCLQNLLDNIENITDQVLPLTVVTTVLDVALNTSKISESADTKEQVTFGNSVIKASEKLISSLVKPTDTSDNVSFTLDSIEVQVFMIGPKFSSDQISQLDTKNASMDIDLVGIAKSNNGTAAVAIMCYSTMETLLKPELFNSSNDTVKTMMSTVISATLPKTTNTELTKPVNFTLKHIREFDPSGSLSCVYWNISEWIVDGCSVLETNSSYTVCSCVHLSTFALIMQTSRPPKSDSLLDLLNLVCVIMGLVFFSLSLLTFALCQWSPGVNNVARINLCISLLLAHLLFLLTQQFLNLIRRHQVLCAVISGVLHFLFLSGFVWMFIEAVLLFICVKNLSQISSKKREVLSTGYLCVIGYMIALVVVGVSVGLVPEGYGSKHCWIKMDKGFIWSFLGPVCVILALNMILFICITISLNSTLKNLNAELSQMKQSNKK